jgi:hypothetical protein
MNILKSIGAVVAGFITVVLLSIGSDFILESSGFFPPPSAQGLFVPWMLALALAYRSIYTIAGGYITAMLAPNNPDKHVLILAGIGFIAGVGGAVAGWNLSAHWYPIALAVTGPLFVWFGGWLRIKTPEA